jgi:hypothetical protein
MGVGVYSSTFNGTGGTFIVDMTPGGEEEYQQYLRDNGPEDLPSFEEWRKDYSDGDEAGEDEYKEFLVELTEESCLSFELWQQDQVDALVEGMEATVHYAARQLGMDPVFSRGGRYDRASFDSEFVSAATSRYVEIGWRSWQDDFIVGIAGDSDARNWIEDPEGYAEEIIDNTGLAPSKFAEIYGSLADAVQDYVRLSLMRDGHDCRFKTSGYTSSSYQEPEEGYDAPLEKLREKIVSLQAQIPNSFRDGVILATSAEREEIARAIYNDNANIPAFIPLYDPERAEMRIYCPDRRKFVHQDLMPPEFEEAMQSFIAEHAASTDFLAIPRTEELAEAWKSLQTRFPDEFVVSAQEWAEVSGDELKVEWTDLSDTTWEADVIFPSEAPHPTP